MDIDALNTELIVDPEKIGYNNPAESSVDSAGYYMTDQQAANRLNALDTVIDGRLGSRAEELGLGHVTERHVRQAREK